MHAANDLGSLDRLAITARAFKACPQVEPKTRLNEVQDGPSVRASRSAGGERKRRH